MPFIPHTPEDIQSMLKEIGISDNQTLFDEIPAEMLCGKFESISPGLNESELMSLMKKRAQQDYVELNFIGAGAYEHHIPAAVWDIASRGEFMTAYTPYQAEASQGTLQLLYEYQTMMANLTGMDVSNASLYDGASALAEAVLMAVRLKKLVNNREAINILIPESVNPFYIKTVKAIISQQNIYLTSVPIDNQNGIVNIQTLENIIENNHKKYSALIIPQPNFFGRVELCADLTDWAHAHDLIVIAVVNPMSLALFKEPGQWGEKGADIVCGELQPFGIPLASGGPYAGFLCTREAYIRQMPGRIAGATIDKNGRRGFTLTLQAREQHIRRGKAVSNICTNQGLLVTAATIYMSLLGFEGLKRAAAKCHDNAVYLGEQLKLLPGIKPVFNSKLIENNFFHEIAVKFESISVKTVLNKLADKNILGGYPLEADYPDRQIFADSLLMCVTETKTHQDIDNFIKALREII